MNSKAARLLLALVITLLFVGFEVAGGLFANSLALLTDAAHNLTDVVALGLSWYALRLADRPAHSGKTFGYHRAGILAAFVNSATLGAIAIGIFYEAYRRFVEPPPVNGGVLTALAAVAFLVNAGTAWLVRHNQNDLNMRSAFVHLAGDAVSTLGALLAGIAIIFTGLNWLDPLVSVLIGALILYNAWGILRETVDILLEGTPRDVNMSTMVADILRVEGVAGVHDLHVWSITRNMRALSAHLFTQDVPLSVGAAIQRQVNEVLVSKYGIAHSALQLECAGCEPDVLYCDLERGNGANDPIS